MSDEQVKGMWAQAKETMSNNRVVTGMVAGGAAGSIVPGIGTAFGIVVGGVGGYWSAKEHEKAKVQGLIMSRK